MPNTNWKTTRITTILALVFLIGIFVPSFIGMDGFHGGFALATFSGFLMMVFTISAFVFGAVARQQDKLFAGQNLLVHWTYTADEWRQYYADESTEDRKTKTWLFYIVAFWEVVFGIGFPIYDPKDGIFVSYMMLGLIILIGFVAWLSIRITRHKLEKHGGEAWISTTGAYIAGQMHSWTIVGGSLIDVSCLTGEKQSQIRIDYMGGNTEYSVHIPVPAGREDEAKIITQTLAAQISRQA